MKTLVVVRHAKSSWDDPKLNDFDRPLNERGRRDAPRMAKRLKEKDLTINRMITSAAQRAQTTCDVFADVLAFPKDRIERTRDLYHAGAEQVLVFLKNLKEPRVDHEVVMIFGHNPGLTEFVDLLVDAEIDNIPTTGIACCRLSIDRWEDIHWGCGRLDFFDWPKSTRE